MSGAERSPATPIDTGRCDCEDCDPFVERPATPCRHESARFDRTICAFCNSMHSYCEACGVQLEECIGVSAPRSPATLRTEAGQSLLNEHSRREGEERGIARVHLSRHILAIEAEAHSAGRYEGRAEVAALIETLRRERSETILQVLVLNELSRRVALLAAPQADEPGGGE